MRLFNIKEELDNDDFEAVLDNEPAEDVFSPVFAQEDEPEEIIKEESPASDNIEETDEKRDEVMRLIEEDALLVQIDAFREKAKTLQTLINDRQNKVIELEEIVKDKEEKNSALLDELKIKQDVLDETLAEIKSQLNIFADRLDTSMNNAVSEAKDPIMEKIHSENVRLYRNLFDFLKDEYNREKLYEFINKTSNKGKGIGILTFILAIGNMAVLIVILLMTMGII